MARIRVEPRSLRSLSGKIRYEMYVLEGIQNRLSAAVYSFDWETRAITGVSGLWRSGRSKGRSTGERGHYMANYLLHVANRFEAADRYGIRRDRYTFFQPGMQLPIALLLPEQRVRTALGIEDEDYRKLISPCLLPAAIAPALIVGTLGLADRLIKDQSSRNHLVGLCFEAIKRLRGGMKCLPFIGSAVGTFLEFLEARDFSRRGFQIAFNKNALELAMASNPYGAIALTTNSVVQLGGSSLIWGPTRLTQLYVGSTGDVVLDTSAARTAGALKKWDLGNISRDIGSIVNDGFVEPRVLAGRDLWDNPSLGNYSRVFAPALLGPAGGLGQALFDYRARGLLWQDARMLAGHTGDFLVGNVQVPAEFMRHGMTGIGVNGAEMAGRILPPDMASRVSAGCDYFVERINAVP